MCGIVGTVAPLSDRRRQVIRAMNDAIAHRGPDDDGYHEDEDVALAMRRLAIIDVAHGAQPVYSETGDVVVVFNGEIYNYRRLQDDLRARGHHLSSDSDTEVIPHLYEEYGLDFATHLRGMFAIALWDRTRRRVVLARDRLGKKPLFYRVGPDGLAFASELPALLADGRVSRVLDREALSHYLTFQYVPAPFSIYKSIRKVRPGHLVVWQPGKLNEHRYWELRFPEAVATAPADPDSLAEEFRDRLLEAVNVRLVSERPVGAFLSGGLDSSAIVAAMSQVSSHRVRTFSIGFEDDGHNELPHARRVAEHYDTEHHELVVKPDALEVLPVLARAFGEPFADSSAVPSYYVAEMAAASVVVTLNGDGGDEMLGGYTRYLEYLAPGSTAPPPSVSKRARAAAARLVHRRPLRSGGQPDADRYGRLVSYFDPESKARVLSGDVRASTPDTSYQVMAGLWDAHRGPDEVNRLLAVDTASYLPGDLLTKVDITTMQHSLEARSPLLDHELIEWAATVPGDLKVRGGTTKWLMKRALAPWLPPDLLHRPKQGFAIPLDAWMRGPLRPVLGDELVSGRAVQEGWLDGPECRRLVRLHRLGADVAYRLYALLMLELWVREVHDAPPRVPA